WAFFVDTTNGQITAKLTTRLSPTVDGQKMAFPSINLASYRNLSKIYSLNGVQYEWPQPVVRDGALTVYAVVAAFPLAPCLLCNWGLVACRHHDAVYRPIPDVADNLKLHQATHACIS